MGFVDCGDSRVGSDDGETVNAKATPRFDPYPLASSPPTRDVAKWRVHFLKDWLGLVCPNSGVNKPSD